MRILLSLAFAGALGGSASAQTCNTFGSSTHCKNGLSAQRLGNFTYWSDGLPLKESARSRTTAMAPVHSALERAPTTATELLRRLWATRPTSVTAGPVSGPEISSTATNANEIRDARAARGRSRRRSIQGAWLGRYQPTHKTHWRVSVSHCGPMRRIDSPEYSR